MKIVLQHDQYDCGAACLSMIAQHYGLYQPISKYRELTKTDRAGANIYGLVDGAKKIGLDADALSGTPEELMESIKTGDIIFPFVAHTVTEEGLLHYIVVFGIKHGSFVIGDPGRGKCRLTEKEFFKCWTGYIIKFSKTPFFVPENQMKGRFFRFFLLLKGQYSKLAIVSLISLIVAAIGVAGSFVFELVIDNYYTEASAFSGMNGALSLSIIFSALIFLYFLQAIIQIIRGHLIVSVSKSLDIRLSLSYYNHVVDLPISSASMYQTGEYISRFSDSATIRQAVSGATLSLLLDSIMVVVGGIILYFQNRLLFGVSFIMILLYAGVILFYRKPVERYNRTAMENSAKLQAYFKESIDGLETIKAMNAGEEVKATTTHKFMNFINSSAKSNLVAFSQDVISDAIQMIGTVVILWIGFLLVATSHMSIGTLITFYALLAYFINPIKNLIELQPQMQTAMIAADRLSDILDLQTEETRALSKSDDPSIINTLEFKKVCFRYGNHEQTLQDISLSIKRGEKIAIVGESGSGKTTLAKLLLRFYEPEQGEILINGCNIKEINLTHLRQAISYVSQNTFLFSDTVKNNLKLGNPDVSDKDMYRVCKMCAADHFIDNLPLGYDTLLDENAMNLSGGQKQRLSIARALLRNPQLLILDEATSNLDTVTEYGIRNTLYGLSNDLTCIIIAHRLSTIRNCDKIYVLEAGVIVESGTHEELLLQNGKYADLWSHQGTEIQQQ